MLVFTIFRIYIPYILSWVYFYILTKSFLGGGPFCCGHRPVADEDFAFAASRHFLRMRSVLHFLLTLIRLLVDDLICK